MKTYLAILLGLVFIRHLIRFIDYIQSPGLWLRWTIGLIILTLYGIGLYLVLNS